jgi:hypothetical protein
MSVSPDEVWQAGITSQLNCEETMLQGTRRIEAVHTFNSRPRHITKFQSRHDPEGGPRPSDRPIIEALLAILNSGATTRL